MDNYSNMALFISTYKKRIISIFVSLLVLSLITTYCSLSESEGITSGPEVLLINHSECKDFNSSRNTFSLDSSIDCIQFDYNGSGVLTLTHINAGFNCCPGQITANINIEDNIIIIEEAEEIAGCHCNCLYDIDYQITNLTPGVYTIKVIEPYVGGDEEQLEFTISLTGSLQDSYCLERDTYPWGI